MASKVAAQKFDRINKSVLKTRGKTSRTGASTARNRHHAHGNNHKKR